jgi:hypothetical protein
MYNRRTYKYTHTYIYLHIHLLYNKSQYSSIYASFDEEGPQPPIYINIYICKNMFICITGRHMNMHIHIFTYTFIYYTIKVNILGYMLHLMKKVPNHLYISIYKYIFLCITGRHVNIHIHIFTHSFIHYTNKVNILVYMLHLMKKVPTHL